MHLLDPDERHALRPAGDGWFAAELDGVAPGRRYRYRLDGGDERPDPASRSPARGRPRPLRGRRPRRFAWTDGGWRGRAAATTLVLYELHVGTFTPEGTFDADRPPAAPSCASSGVTAVELMPVAAVPRLAQLGLRRRLPLRRAGRRYGGPEGLRRLVDAAHAHGPRGLPRRRLQPPRPGGQLPRRVRPVLHRPLQTPWGERDQLRRPRQRRGAPLPRRQRPALARGVPRRRRCGSTPSTPIFDPRRVHLLAELADAVRRAGATRLGRPLHLIAESDLNDPRLCGRREPAGSGSTRSGPTTSTTPLHCAAHRRARRLLRGLRRALGAGQRATATASSTTGRSSPTAAAGTAPAPGGCPASQLRRLRAEPRPGRQPRRSGERLATLAGARRALQLAAAAAARLAVRAAAVHGRGVRRAGALPVLRQPRRRRPGRGGAAGPGGEFAGFEWSGDPPDPQSEETFARSRIGWESRGRVTGRRCSRCTASSWRSGASRPALRRLDTARVETARLPGTLWVRRDEDGDQALVCLHTAPADAELELPFEGSWTVALDSADERLRRAGRRLARTAPCWPAPTPRSCASREHA